MQFFLETLQRVLPTGSFVRTEQPISGDDSEPEPELAVIKGRKEDFKTDHPRTAELVIEVCVSSHEYDRSKLRAYATAQVKEVWLVLVPEQQIEVYRLPKENGFAQPTFHGPGGQLTSAAVPSFTVDLAALFAK